MLTQAVDLTSFALCRDLCAVGSGTWAEVETGKNLSLGSHAPNFASAASADQCSNQRPSRDLCTAFLEALVLFFFKDKHTVLGKTMDATCLEALDYARC